MEKAKGIKEEMKQNKAKQNRREKGKKGEKRRGEKRKKELRGKQKEKENGIKFLDVSMVPHSLTDSGG